MARSDEFTAHRRAIFSFQKSRYIPFYTYLCPCAYYLRNNR